MEARSAALLAACCRRRLACHNAVHRTTPRYCRSGIQTAAIDHSNAETSSCSAELSASNTYEEYKAAQRDFQQYVKLRQLRIDLFKRLAPSRLANAAPARLETGKTLSESTEGPISLADFRQKLCNAKPGDAKAFRALLSKQMQDCTTPQDMLHVLVIAMTDLRPQVGLALSRLESTTKEAWYRCRDKTSDPHVLRTIMQFIRRFEMAGLPVHPSHRVLAVKFAARCRDLNLMHRCLRKYKDNVGHMSTHSFRSVVAKCSIGRRGLGAIRNGSWEPDQLRQVLVGFDCERHLPEHERCHLRTFLERQEWQYLHGFVSALGIVKANDLLQEEWELFKQNPFRTRPRKLKGTPDPFWTSKTRGELLFVEFMQMAGDHERAWQIFRECDLSFDKLKPWVLHNLIKDAHLAGHTAPRLQKHLITTYGDRQLSSGELLKSLCILDSVDSDGHAVFSKDNAAAIHEILEGTMSWFALYVPGKTDLATCEAEQMHEAETGELVEDADY